MTSESLDQLDALLHERMDAMKNHRVFSAVTSVESLRTFMQWHVFAVWDFMSLVKRLQRDLTCVTVPWLPPEYPNAARLINEIVLAEESDNNGDGGHTSHFDLYVRAMHDVGASTQAIDDFVDALIAGESVTHALTLVKAPLAVRHFVSSTLHMAMTGSTEEVLGCFFYGRENVIPSLFQSLLANGTVAVAAAPSFVHYWQRQIVVEGNARGLAINTLIGELLCDDKKGKERLLTAALFAVDNRIRLWDALAQQLGATVIERQHLATMA